MAKMFMGSKDTLTGRRKRAKMKKMKVAGEEMEMVDFTGKEPGEDIVEVPPPPRRRRRRMR